MSTINGTAGDDKLVGTSGADVMDGGAGKDRLNGGDGDDIVSGGDGNDYVYGDGGNDTLYGGAGNDALVGHSGQDEIYGEDGNDGVFGGGDADRIFGGAGNDTLYGDGGGDYIDGGEGDDKLFGGSGNDTLVYTAGQGNDTLVGNTGVDTLELVLTAADLESSRGEIVEFANWLEGELATAGGEGAHAGQNNGNTFTFESLGLEVSSIEAINIVVDGQSVPLEDLLNRAPVVDAEQTVNGLEDNAINGAVVATDPDGDTLSCAVTTDPAHGAVVMNAETGVFTYTPSEGFSGTDTFMVTVVDGQGASTQQVVTVEVAEVADAPVLSVTAPVTSGGGTQINGTGSSDTIVGTAGDDVIQGGSGNDTIYGDDASGSGNFEVAFEINAALNDGDGSETLSVEVSGLPSGASLSAGSDLGNGTWILGAGDLDGLKLVLTEAADTTITVTATATEAGGATQSVSQSVPIQFSGDQGGNDIIQGGSGNDVIHGGGGVDLVDLSDAPGGVYVDLSANFSVGNGYDVFTGIEGAIGSDSADTFIGNNGDNVFEGGDGGDAIYAFGGDDQISGGAGNDALYGYDGNDVISDGSGNDSVYGDNGDDTIIAGSGNDYYHGGSGNDTVDFSQSTSGVEVELKSGKSDGDDSGKDRLVSIENVIGSSGNDEIEGDSGDNILSGGDGNDRIEGGRGEDVLIGGAGADTFVFKNSDVVSGRNHHGVDRIADFGAGDRLDFDSLLKGVKYNDLSEVVQLTETSEGTMVSVEMNGAAGWTDVVLLEGMFDLELDFLEGGGQIIV